MSIARPLQLVHNIIFRPVFFSLRPMARVSYIFLSRSKVRPLSVLYIVFMFINTQIFILRDIQSGDCIFGFPSERVKLNRVTLSVNFESLYLD